MGQIAAVNKMKEDIKPVRGAIQVVRDAIDVKIPFEQLPLFLQVIKPKYDEVQEKVKEIEQFASQLDQFKEFKDIISKFTEGFDSIGKQIENAIKIVEAMENELNGCIIYCKIAQKQKELGELLQEVSNIEKVQKKIESEFEDLMQKFDEINKIQSMDPNKALGNAEILLEGKMGNLGSMF